MQLKHTRWIHVCWICWRVLILKRNNICSKFALRVDRFSALYISYSCYKTAKTRPNERPSCDAARKRQLAAPLPNMFLAVSDFLTDSDQITVRVASRLQSNDAWRPVLLFFILFFSLWWDRDKFGVIRSLLCLHGFHFVNISRSCHLRLTEVL